jgi:hypothetical protein
MRKKNNLFCIVKVTEVSYPELGPDPELDPYPLVTGADPDPDPHQSVTDPHHCFIHSVEAMMTIMDRPKPTPIICWH